MINKLGPKPGTPRSLKPSRLCRVSGRNGGQFRQASYHPQILPLATSSRTQQRPAAVARADALVQETLERGKNA
jgi:hypothetical protein